MLLRVIIWSTVGVLFLATALPTTTEEYPVESTTDFPLTTQSENEQEEPGANEVFPNEVFSSYAEDNDTPLDVNGTIEEVEKILESNPNLPRLSRGEILEILDNLTASRDKNVKNELLRHQSSEQSYPNDQKSREEYAKALMLVLPFNAKDMSDTKIQELYTKAPVTKIVDKPGDDVIFNRPSQQYRYTPPTISITEIEDDYFPHDVTEQPYDIPSIPSTRFSTSSSYQAVSKTTKQPVLKQPAPAPANPSRKVNKFSNKPFKEQASATDDSYSIGKEPEPTRNSGHFSPTPVEITESYHDAVYSSIQAIEATTNHQDSRHPEPSAAPFLPITDSTTVNQPSPSHNFPKSPNTVVNNQVTRHRKRRPTGRPAAGYRATTNTYTATSTEGPQSPDFQLGLPQDIKQLSVSFEVQDHIQPPSDPQPTFFMTPIPEVTEKVRYNSQYTGNRVITTTTQEPALDDNVQEALASIGLYPEQLRPQPFHHRVPVTEKTTTTTTTTTEAPMLDLSQAAESLSPDMKELLISFGLLPSPDGETTSVQTPISPIPLSRAHAASPVIDPSSYVSFKPLPVGTAPAGGDMQDFLASYGLVSASDTGRETYHNFRSQKALPTSSKDNMPKSKPIKAVPNFSTEILTDEMREVLESLGILPTSISRKNPSMNDDTKEKEHVFNPSQHIATLNPSEEEAERLNKLLRTIKKFVKENGTLTPEQMTVIDASFPLLTASNNSTTSTTTTPDTVTKKTKTKFVPLDQIGNAPDPLALEELLQLYDANKNEVKRQQPNDTNSNTTDSSTESTEQRVPSFDALAESFGGGETAPSDANVEEQLPPARPNGLYFLLDWNSFLEVGEEGKNKVNIRIAPKVGDPRNFLPVTVP
ncbi:mucin-2 [Anabrus simplex]|uniref:mucin-2 n=1 Tax=Anabrus simplex TaxID=316456 RepID=UPI0035A297A3